MDDKYLTFKIKWKFLLWIFIALLIGYISFITPYEKVSGYGNFSSAYFNGSIVEGEFLFDEISAGYTSKGFFVFPELDRTPSNLSFKFNYDDYNCILEYYFPTDYLEFQYEFNVSQDDLEVCNLRKNDKYWNTTLLHWTKMPVLYYINQSGYGFSQYENETKQRKIDDIYLAISKLTSTVPSISMTEVYEPKYANIEFHIKMTSELRHSTEDSYYEGLVIPEMEGNIFTHAHVYVDPTAKSETCQYSYNTALYEILRAFGLEHDSDFGDSIMSANSIEGICAEKKIKKRHIDILKSIYG